MDGLVFKTIIFKTIISWVVGIDIFGFYVDLSSVLGGTVASGVLFIGRANTSVVGILRSFSTIFGATLYAIQGIGLYGVTHSCRF